MIVDGRQVADDDLSFADLEGAMLQTARNVVRCVHEAERFGGEGARIPGSTLDLEGLGCRRLYPLYLPWPAGRSPNTREGLEVVSGDRPYRSQLDAVEPSPYQRPANIGLRGVKLDCGLADGQQMSSLH